MYIRNIYIVHVLFLQIPLSVSMYITLDTNSLSLTEEFQLSVTQLTQHSIALSWLGLGLGVRVRVSVSSGYYMSYERLDFSVPVTQSV